MSKPQDLKDALKVARAIHESVKPQDLDLSDEAVYKLLTDCFIRARDHDDKVAGWRTPIGDKLRECATVLTALAAQRKAVLAKLLTIEPGIRNVDEGSMAWKLRNLISERRRILGVKP